MKMSQFIIIFFITLLTLLGVQTDVSAQNSACASVTSITTSAQSVQGGTQFTCSVTVSSQFANSSSIACGISVNGQFPSNVCPSDTDFGGWNGSTALFNCTLPSLDLSQVDTIEAVGYDFSQNCGPQTGKRLSLAFTKPTPDSSQPTSTPDTTPQPVPSNITAPWNTPSPAPTLSPLDKTTQPFQDLLELLFGITKNPTKPGTDPTAPDNPPGTQPTPTPNPITNTVPNGTFVNIQQLLEYVGTKTGVPYCVLNGIAHIEYGSIFSQYTPAEIVAGSVPGQVMRNCPNNSCSATGVTQMTTGVDNRGNRSCSQCCWQGKCLNSCPNAWATYGNAVNEFEGSNHIPSACNIKDNIFGAAKKLATDSKNSGPGWNRERIKVAATRFFGNCSVAVINNRTYCDEVISYCDL